MVIACVTQPYVKSQLCIQQVHILGAAPQNQCFISITNFEQSAERPKLQTERPKLQTYEKKLNLNVNFDFL